MLSGPAMLLAGQSQPQVMLVVSIAGLILASLLLFGIFVWLRKRLLGDSSSAGDVLSIQQVRQMHREGKISDEEFEALRRAALLAAGVAADRIGGDRVDDAVSPRRVAGERTADGGLRAPPGYDLTGEPLPGSVPGEGDEKPGASGNHR
jgi:hypothetical protein